MNCSVCRSEVTDGVVVLKAGVARHVTCEIAEPMTRVTLTLTSGNIATFKQLGGGNASLGARRAAEVCNALTAEELERIQNPLDTKV